MERDTTLDQNSPQSREALSGGETPTGAPFDDSLCPEKQHQGTSLVEMAQRDLAAALQLLAERAQYITAASGAAIALREGGRMLCRASAGPSAPKLGAELQIGSGLSGESVRTRQILRCDDAETDERVNRDSCRVLGITSVIVMPLVVKEEVTGVFELFSSRPYAFEERDTITLQRLAEMIATALEHAEAIKHGAKEIAAQPEDETNLAPELQTALLETIAPTETTAAPVDEVKQPAGEATTAAEPRLDPKPKLAPHVVLSFASAEEKPGDDPKLTDAPSALAEHGTVGKCETCGLPISGGRTFCVACEQAKGDEASPVLSADQDVPGFLSQYTGGEENWLRAHKYWLAILLALIIVLAALWRAR